MIEGLNLRARGVLMTLLFLCDKEGRCDIQMRKFARENGLSHQEIRTIISKLLSTHWITHSATHLGTQGITHLTLNISAIKDIVKNFSQHIQQHNEQHILSPETTDHILVKKDNPETMDWEGFKDFFNEKVKASKIPQVRVLTEARKRQIKGLLKKYSKKDLVKVIDICVNTPWLRGENDRGWTVSIDWIYTEKNFVKIMEGNYDWQRNNSETGHASGRSQGRGATLEGVAREILRSSKARKD